MDLIAVTPKEGVAFGVKVRSHSLTTDMSEKEGGKDGGPSPVELLACSLGTCIATMVKRYCDTHGYRDGAVGVSLTVELADDPKRVGAFVVDLEVPKDVPEEKKAAIRRVAELCPVHATLRHPPRVDVEVV